MSLTLVKNNVENTVQLSETAQKLIAERINPRATLFAEHGSYFVGVEQNPGRLILGHGETIAEALQYAIDNQDDKIYAPGQARKLGL